jgi:hypothetical protein
MSYVSSVLHRFGLLNDSASPSERVFVRDVSEETSVSPRQVPDRNADSEGQTVFAAFNSTWELSAFDLEGLPTAEAWMTAQEKVQGVAVLQDAVIQWTEPSRIVPTSALSPGEAALVRADYVMRRDAGDIGSHGVYLTRNALTPVGASGAISATLAWPVDGAGLTLSADFSSVDGTETLALEALDSDKTTVIDSATANPGSSGRVSLDFTTPDGTYYLAVEVSGASPSKPSLRVDGSDQYVPK